jgi:hypothetical protein
MTGAVDLLRERLAPVRESTITALLTAQARAIDAGAEIEPEPVRRTPQGAVKREGRLDLPTRGDLSVTLDGRTLVQRVEGRRAAPFDPFVPLGADGPAAVVAPFRWEEAEVYAEAGAGTPNWEPLRLWYLEWFQTRQTRLAPELCGGLHSLSGPDAVGAGWRLRVDFGSAPLAAVKALLVALDQTGVGAIRIGDRPH